MPPGADALDFRGIQAFDANTAIVMSVGKGDLSRLYKTTDTCRSWRVVFTNPSNDGFFDAISFSKHSQTGHAEASGVLIGQPVGGAFAIFLSTNDGENWRPWGRSGFGRKGECGELRAQRPRRTNVFSPVASLFSISFQRTSCLSPGADRGLVWCTRICTTSTARRVGSPSHRSGCLSLGLVHLPEHSP